RAVPARLTYPFVAALVAALSQPQEGDRARPETEETPAPEQPASEQTEPQETVEQPPEGGKTDPWHDPEKAR
ncbi:hypothetical protein KBZ21_52115, partial [Streptomyces sp. A73]|nr:hypothetical protein [Streptomyces sp. A73]